MALADLPCRANEQHPEGSVLLAAIMGEGHRRPSRNNRPPVPVPAAEEHANSKRPIQSRSRQEKVTKGQPLGSVLFGDAVRNQVTAPATDREETVMAGSFRVWGMQDRTREGGLDVVGQRRIGIFKEGRDGGPPLGYRPLIFGLVYHIGVEADPDKQLAGVFQLPFAGAHDCRRGDPETP
jgi:hypothetical protein